MQYISNFNKKYKQDKANIFEMRSSKYILSYFEFISIISILCFSFLCFSVPKGSTLWPL